MDSIITLAFGQARAWSVACLLVLLGACGEATEPQPIPAGVLQARISGAISDVFAASGAEPPPTLQPVTFAGARPGALPGVLAIGGFRARGQAQDALVLNLSAATEPGSYEATGIFNYGIVDRDFTTGTVFQLTGRVIIEKLTTERVQGTFQATGVTVEIRLDGSQPDTVRITNGRFDVPIAG